MRTSYLLTSPVLHLTRGLGGGLFCGHFFSLATLPIPSLILRGLTSTDEAEIRACVQAIKATHAGTGYLHESFHKDDPTKYTRA